MDLRLLLGVLLLLTACHAQKETGGSEAEKIAIPENAIVDELLVGLVKEGKPEVLEQTFATYGFKKVRSVSRNMRAYLFNFDTAAIAPGSMFLKVKSHPHVETVEFNKKVEQRDSR